MYVQYTHIHVYRSANTHSRTHKRICNIHVIEIQSFKIIVDQFPTISLVISEYIKKCLALFNLWL